jgi:hypothetical protein
VHVAQRSSCHRPPLGGVDISRASARTATTWVAAWRRHWCSPIGGGGASCPPLREGAAARPRHRSHAAITAPAHRRRGARCCLDLMRGAHRCPCHRLKEAPPEAGRRRTCAGFHVPTHRCPKPVARRRLKPPACWLVAGCPVPSPAKLIAGAGRPPLLPLVVEVTTMALKWN